MAWARWVSRVDTGAVAAFAVAAVAVGVVVVTRAASAAAARAHPGDVCTSAISRGTANGRCACDLGLKTALGCQHACGKTPRLTCGGNTQDLKDHMRSTGEVLHADVLHGPDGRSKGCGLVEFQTPDEAQRAIQELNDTELMGRMIFVREDREAR